jgi:hypothetical protein
MLLLLTILGASLLSTATTDLQVAGNYRNNLKAFYLSDYAYEYLKSDASAAGVYDLLPLQNDVTTITKSLPADPDGNVEKVSYTVTNIGCLKGAPPGSGTESGTGNDYNVYAIEINGVTTNHASASTMAGNLYQRGKPCDD